MYSFNFAKKVCKCLQQATLKGLHVAWEGKEKEIDAKQRSVTMQYYCILLEGDSELLRWTDFRPLTFRRITHDALTHTDNGNNEKC